MSLRSRAEGRGSSLLSDADRRRLLAIKFPKEFNIPVEMDKVQFDVVKIWIAQQMLAMVDGDDIVTEYTISLFEQSNNPDIKAIQIQLEGFLPTPEAAKKFCKDIWRLLIDAQRSPSGVPSALVEMKKKELRENAEKRPSISQRVIEHALGAETVKVSKLDEIKVHERAQREERRAAAARRESTVAWKGSGRTDTEADRRRDEDRRSQRYSEEYFYHPRYRERERSENEFTERDRRRSRSRSRSRGERQLYPDRERYGGCHGEGDHGRSGDRVDRRRRRDGGRDDRGDGDRGYDGYREESRRLTSTVSRTREHMYPFKELDQHSEIREQSRANKGDRGLRENSRRTREHVAQQGDTRHARPEMSPGRMQRRLERERAYQERATHNSRRD
ncbi:hypothetical protein V1512DRAFT_281049 [Lipomyces arxii]|uniref:uncharacterized protein n=1 Tax=Lipomyces arxii TaxID=56418 RepID=UPI0034CE512E